MSVDDAHLAESDEDRPYDCYGLDQHGIEGVTGTTGGGGPADADLSRTVGARDGSDVSDGRRGGELDSGSGTTTGGPSGAGHDVFGPSTDEAMTPSVEHLEVGTTRRESGRARLRKHVTTEQELVTVRVQRERAALETGPITDANVGDAHRGRRSRRRRTRWS